MHQVFIEQTSDFVEQVIRLIPRLSPRSPPEWLTRGKGAVNYRKCRIDPQQKRQLPVPGRLHQRMRIVWIVRSLLIPLNT
ncbi:hypothetical protein ACLB1N_29750 [Escherichia coli]